MFWWSYGSIWGRSQASTLPLSLIVSSTAQTKSPFSEQSRTPSLKVFSTRQLVFLVLSCHSETGFTTAAQDGI